MPKLSSLAFIFPQSSGHWRTLKKERKQLFEIYHTRLCIVFVLSLQLRKSFFISCHTLMIGTELLPILMVFFILIDSVLDNVLILSGEVVFWSLLRANGSENLEINFQRLLNLQMLWFLLLFNQTEKSEVEFVANWLVDHSTSFKPNNRNVSSKINDSATVAIFYSTTTCCYCCYCCCLNSNPGEE